MCLLLAYITASLSERERAAVTQASLSLDKLFFYCAKTASVFIQN